MQYSFTSFKSFYLHDDGKAKPILEGNRRKYVASSVECMQYSYMEPSRERNARESIRSGLVPDARLME